MRDLAEPGARCPAAAPTTPKLYWKNQAFQAVGEKTSQIYIDSCQLPKAHSKQLSGPEFFRFALRCLTVQDRHSFLGRSSLKREKSRKSRKSRSREVEY